MVKPRAFDHKSRMRLLEHGTEWKVLVGLGDNHPNRLGPRMILLQAKDGYLKWWPAEFA